MIKKAIYFFTFVVLIYSGYLLILLSIPYLSEDSEVDFLSTKQLIYHIKHWRYSFYIHVFSSCFLFFSGLIQFIPFFFRKFPRIHKIAGYIYIIILLFVSGPAAFIMSLYANGGYPSQFSFVILSILWILTTLKAVHSIKIRDFKSHSNWMLRSYLLTLSAVTLRFYAYLLNVFNFNINPVEAYVILAWISWIPNLIIAEVIIKKKVLLKYFKYSNDLN